MAERRVLAWRPSFPALEDILGSTQAKILTDLLFDYAYKSTNNWQGPECFSINKDTMYFRRSFSAILQYVSITKENLSKNIKALKELGLLKVKENIGDVYEFKVELFSEPYIVLAKQKLETVKDKYTRKRIQDFIDIASQHELILDALIYPTKKVINTDEPQETKSPKEKEVRYEEKERQREALLKCSNGNSITWDDL